MNQGLRTLFLLPGNHGDINEVFQPRLEVTVQKGVAQDAVILLAVDVKVILQNHAILRERSGLVRTKHIHGAEVLDGIEVFDNHLVFAHRQRALGK